MWNLSGHCTGKRWRSGKLVTSIASWAPKIILIQVLRFFNIDIGRVSERWHRVNMGSVAEVLEKHALSIFITPLPENVNDMLL